MTETETEIGAIIITVLFIIACGVIIKFRNNASTESEEKAGYISYVVIIGIGLALFYNFVGLALNQ